MAQLDRFLSAMVSHRASALRLDEGALAELEIAGASRPVTKSPLSSARIPPNSRGRPSGRHQLVGKGHQPR